MRPGVKLLILCALLDLLIACEPIPDNPPSRNKPPRGSAYVDLAEVLPREWVPFKPWRLDTNRDGEKEWLVFYQFDVPEGRAKASSPISAVIYQPDDNYPPNLIAHELRPLDGDFLCESECKVEMDNVLSGLAGNELVISDWRGGQISRLTIFQWDEGRQEYWPRGHFCGECIEVSVDEIQVKESMHDRAQLTRCETYHAWDNKTYYQSGTLGTPIPCVREEIDFSPDAPEDVCCSPYPEKVVLAFYQNYNKDDEALQFFSEKVRENIGQCDAGECGCAAPRHEIEHVSVLDLIPEPTNEDKATGVERAIVGARIVCERQIGGEESERRIRWILIREDGRWQLQQPIR